MSQCGGSGFVHRRAGNHDEFVAAQPGDQVLPVTGPAQALGQHADEPVARGVSEVVVDRLQPVQIEEQCRDRTRLAGRKSFVQVRQQGAPVVQTGQVIVFGKVTKPLFGQHPGLNLGEQRRDRLQCVEFVGAPLPVAELDEPEGPGRDIARQQGCGGHRRRGHRATLLDPPLVVIGGWFRAQHHRLLGVLRHREHRVGVGEVDDLEWVGVRNVRPDRPLGDQSGGPDLVVVVAKEADVDPEVGHQIGQHTLADFDGGGRSGGHQLGCHRFDHQVEAARCAVHGHCAVRISPVPCERAVACGYGPRRAVR